MAVQPKVSVVMSVYNGEKYLRETLDTAVRQTLQEIEIVLVCNGATDGTLEIMEEYAARDERVLVFPKEYAEAGAGRNYGLERATGKYISFLDGDDLFEPDMLEKAYEQAEKHQAEMVIFGSDKFFEGKRERSRINYPIKSNLPPQALFSGRDAKVCFRTFGYYVWNKLFLRQFLCDNKLKFLEQTLWDDAFLAVTTVCCAERICVLDEVLVHYRCFSAGATANLEKAAKNSYLGLLEFQRWLQECGKWTLFERDFVNLAAEFVLGDLDRLQGANSAESYERLHDGGLQALSLTNRPAAYFYKQFQALEIQRIQTLTYEEYRQALSPGCSKVKHVPELIVSLTSHPSRIDTVHKGIYSILCQSEKADQVILWLSEDEFPERESELPEKLLELRQFGLTIAWGPNLKSYNKLIPALREYPESVIVTADDDILYNTDWLKILWESYLLQPENIHCHRPAMLEIKDDQRCWTRTGKRFYPEATYLHRGISHAGILYPPHCLHPDVVREELFLELAPTNDDLWFWFMALRGHTRIQAAHPNIPTPKFIESTQGVTLSSVNHGPGNLFEKDFEKLSTHFPDVPALLEGESK